MQPLELVLRRDGGLSGVLVEQGGVLRDRQATGSRRTLVTVGPGSTGTCQRPRTQPMTTMIPMIAKIVQSRLLISTTSMPMRSRTPQLDPESHRVRSIEVGPIEPSAAMHGEVRTVTA